MLSHKKFLRSLSYAGRGLFIVAKEEQSFRLQLLAAAVVVALMFFFDLRQWEKTTLFLVIASVLVLELINSIIERIVDMMTPRLHDYAAAVKDIMAAAVLLASFVAAVIGLIIFLPYFNSLVW